MILYGGNSGIIDDVYFLIGGGSVSAYYATAVVMNNVNRYYHATINEILQSPDGWNPETTSSAFALSSNTQAYTMPTDILRPERVEVTYNGTDWVLAEYIDRGEIDSTIKNTADVNDVYSQGSPYYLPTGTKIEFFPVPDSNSASAQIWFSKVVTELSGATMEPTFAEPFHRILSYGGAKDYFLQKGLNQSATNMDIELEKLIMRMKKFYSTRVEDTESALRGHFFDVNFR